MIRTKCYWWIQRSVMFRVIYLPHSDIWSKMELITSEIYFDSRHMSNFCTMYIPQFYSRCCNCWCAEVGIVPKIGKAYIERDRTRAFWWSQLEGNAGRSLSKIDKKTFLYTVETCINHWSQLSKITPKYFWLPTICNQYKYLVEKGKDQNHSTLHFEI